MKNRIAICLAATLMLSYLAQSALRVGSSKAHGMLHGVVTDPSGAVIPRALVTISSGEFLQSASTDETGQYRFPGLAPGHYRVRITSTGFSAFKKAGLVLSPGYETEANAQLVIPASRQEITVTDRAQR